MGFRPVEWAALDEDEQAFWIEWYNAGHGG
jgi:hypothetical protein